MSTNPYAPPASNESAASRAADDIRAIVRVFRMMSVLGFVQCAFASVVIYSALTQDAPTIGAALAVGTAIIASISIRCWRVATRLRDRSPGADRAARRISWLLIFGLPVFPMVGFCLPVITTIGIMCLWTVKRRYSDYAADREA